MTKRKVEFEALEYGADDGFHPARLGFEGSPAGGWRVTRNGAQALELGPGYRLLETGACGVCSTDLARRFLPFPLPQVTGHELLAHDPEGRRYVVEINASHAARGVAAACPFCASGLPTHCPERLVLGIHDLPGGFGRWVLVPTGAAVEVPAAVPDDAAVLVEPLAAALQAVARMAPAHGETVAVLGPRRLGLLCVAALAADARRRGIELDLLALARRPELLERARAFGARRGLLVEGSGDALPDGLADVVVDTTGSPTGLELAVRLARREVHLKSTHGQAAAGLRHLTELVVDELSLEPLPRDAAGARARPFLREAPGPPRVAWLDAAEPPAWLAGVVELARFEDARAAAAHYAARPAPLPRADAAVVTDAAGVDAAIRPADDERSLVRPRGAVLLAPGCGPHASALLTACTERGLVLCGSRCGSFRDALDLLALDPELRARVASLVTHHFDAAELPRAFDVARTPACIKAVVHHHREDRS